MRVLVQITLPAEAKLIAQTRHTVQGFLEVLGVDSEAADEVVLALDEACANVVRHAFPGSALPYTFRLTAQLSNDEIVLVVEDDGVGFAPETLDLHRPTDTSGRGLQIICHLMTSVEVEPASPDRGTRVRMSRTLV